MTPINLDLADLPDCVVVLCRRDRCLVTGVDRSGGRAIADDLPFNRAANLALFLAARGVRVAFERANEEGTL